MDLMMDKGEDQSFWRGDALYTFAIGPASPSPVLLIAVAMCLGVASNKACDLGIADVSCDCAS
jgi:hypothetical protein